MSTTDPSQSHLYICTRYHECQNERRADLKRIAELEAENEYYKSMANRLLSWANDDLVDMLRCDLPLTIQDICDDLEKHTNRVAKSPDAADW